MQNWNNILAEAAMQTYLSVWSLSLPPTPHAFSLTPFFFFHLLISEQDYNLSFCNEPSDFLSLSSRAASCMLTNCEILGLDSISVVFWSCKPMLMPSPGALIHWLF